MTRYTNCVALLVSSALALGECCDASAQADAPPELTRLIAAARDGYRPSTAAERAAAAATVAATLRGLDAYLARTPQNAPGWHRYLKTAALREQLDSTEPDAELIRGIHRLYASGEKGLEQRPFVAVREALVPWLQRVLANDDAKLAARHAEAITSIETLLARPDVDRDAETLRQLSTEIAWLESHGQSRELVTALTNRFGWSNVYVDGYGSLLLEGFKKPLHEPSPIREHFDGTDVHGQGVAIGGARAEFVPNSSRGELRILVEGTFHSTTTGYNGPMTIYSQGTTPFVSSWTAYLDGSGLTPGSGSTWAKGSVATTGMESRFRSRLLDRVARRVATRKIAEKQEEIDRNTGEGVAKKLGERAQKDVNDELREGHQDFLQKLKYPMSRRGSEPRAMHFSSSSHELHIGVAQLQRGQLSVHHAPPPLGSDRPLRLRLHESAMENMMESAIAGDVVTDQGIRDAIAEAGGKPPAPPPDEDAEPLEIQLVTQRPIEVRFRDNQIVVTIRGDNFSSGDSSSGPMSIQVHYQLVRDGAQFKARRDKEITVEMKGRGLRQASLRAILRRRLLKVLKPEIPIDPIKLTGGWSRLGNLAVDSLETRDGWLLARWRLEVGRK